MKLYVWRGPQVLKNYTSGLVVVAAADMPLAWGKLRAEQPAVWFKLTYGNHHGTYDDEREIEWALSEDDFAAEEGFPLQPEVFEIDALPVLVKNGGE